VLYDEGYLIPSLAKSDEKKTLNLYPHFRFPADNRLLAAGGPRVNIAHDDDNGRSSERSWHSEAT
jgi:hypothetical protein